jgi:arabinogalactan endo-1,4-beta-galactosidase
MRSIFAIFFVYNKRMKRIFIMTMLLMSCAQPISSSDFASSEQPTYDYVLPYDSTFKIGNLPTQPINKHRDDFIKGADISTFEEVITKGGVFYNEFGKEEHLFSILKRAGINLVRIRLWHNPREFHPWNGGYLDLDTVTRLATIAKSYNMKWLLDYHYSDTWADPGHQQKPDAWKDLNFESLVETVYDYTHETMTHFSDHLVVPDYVQIGNEINNGMLWDDGKIYQHQSTNFDHISQLLDAGLNAVNDVSPTTKTILHLASGNDHQQFYTFFLNTLSRGLDVDIIAASYYSYWNGDLSDVADNFYQLAIQFEKDLLLVEIAHAFTLKPNPSGTNIYGPAQHEKATYPTSIQGQSMLLHDVLTMITQVPNALGLGVVYWEPAWIPIADEQGFTSWANQTFFTYEGQVLPSLFTFNTVK